MAEFRINISNLSEGIHEHIFEAEPSKIGLDKRFGGTVRVKAVLDKSLRQICLEADISAEGTFICDRCLVDFKRQIAKSYTMVYIFSDRSTVDLKKDEEIQALSPDTSYIDLDEDVRQYILLAVPQKLLCSEECLGICPVCGVNRNSKKCNCSIKAPDSRWDDLKKLTHN